MKSKSFKEISEEIGLGKFREVMHFMYATQGMSTVCIGDFLNRSDVTIADWLKQLGIEVKSHKYMTYARLGKKESLKVETIDGKRVKTHILTPDEDLVRLIFFAIGDGSIGNYTIQIHQSNKELFPLLYKRMRRFGQVFTDFYTLNERKVSKLEDSDKYRLTLNRSKIARLISDWNGLRLDTVRFILADREMATYAIASFWDAEGSVPADSTKSLEYRTEITQSQAPKEKKNSLELLKEIRNSLKKHWEIKSKIQPLKKYNYKNSYKTKKTRYILRIPQNNLPKFAKKIGVNLEYTKKRENMSKIIENTKDYPQ